MIFRYFLFFNAGYAVALEKPCDCICAFVDRRDIAVNFISVRFKSERDCGTLRLTGQNKLKPPYALLTRFFAIHRDRNAAISLKIQPTLGQPLFLAYNKGVYTLTEIGPDRFIRTEWTQLVPLPTDDLRMLSLTLINASGEQRLLFTFENPAAYLTLPSIV